MPTTNPWGQTDVKPHVRLAAQGLEPRDDDAHADEGSRDRLYWRYGYYVGLKQALAMLTSRGETLH